MGPCNMYPVLLLLFSCACMADVQPEEQVELPNSTEHLSMEEIGAVWTSGEFQQHFIHSELKELRSTVSFLTERLQVTEEQLDQLRRNAYKVAFAATLGPVDTIGPVDTPVTLAYGNVYVNVGGAYNPHTGIFVAPVKGVYFFAVSGLRFSSKVMDLRLFKNEQQIVSLYNGILGNRPESASYSFCLTLVAGDHVYVRLWQNTWVYDNENNHNAFIGYLIFPFW